MIVRFCLKICRKIVLSVLGIGHKIFRKIYRKFVLRSCVNTAPGFSQFHNFDGQHGQEGQHASPYQVLLRSVKSLLRYGDF